MQSLKKNGLFAPNFDMRNLVNFNTSSGKSGNFHFDVLLLSISIWSFSLKSTEELSLMALKKDLNFEEKLTFYFKTDMRKLVKFNLSSGKVWKFSLKKIQRSSVVKNYLWFPVIFSTSFCIPKLCTIL